MSYLDPNTYEDLKRLFPFPLDDFQYDAIVALNAGKSVVVCAPTGSGKTLIGEYAIYRALNNGKRVFYTTPLKALSNQKLRDFRNLFGPDYVGLLTGDQSVNRNAPILVMTTEIFRNMLYGTPIGQVGTSLEDLETVVLDECHYMNDRQRGTVWEESIIYCPTEIQLVALSATVANSRQLTDWINKVHGPTQLIYSDFRPVPLQFSFGNAKGLFPLLDKSEKGINPRLKSRRKQQREGGKTLEPNLITILSELHQRDMLPAIYFIFSRRGCDRAVAEAANLSLVTEAEAAELKTLINDFLRRNPEAKRANQVAPLYRGIAAHHAGILPAWKGLVEELFQRGLIKVVFATETLAAGINMPARTTVISTLSKRTDRGHRLLNPSEFLQMAGRAGRRGMDEVGYVITLQTRFEGAKEAAYLATSGADPLVSQFTPSYGMVLNLLQIHTLEEAKELIERSFGQYLSTLTLIPEQQEIKNLEDELKQLQAKLEVGIDLVSLEEILADYEKLRGHYKEAKRLLKILRQQAEDLRQKQMASKAPFALPGTLISLQGKHVPTSKNHHSPPISAVLAGKIPGPGQAPYFLCFGRDNRWYVVVAADIIGLYGDLPPLTAIDQLELPTELRQLGRCQLSNETTEWFSQSIPELPIPPEVPEVIAQLEDVNFLEQKLADHPANQWGNPANLLKRKRRIIAIQQEIYQRQSELEDYLNQHWQEFVNLISILQTFGGLDDLEPTRLGQATAAIRGDNELWLGLALTSGAFDNLEPAQLAAACAALVTEVSRPDSWTHYEVSPPVDEALAELRRIRHQLFQVQRRFRVAVPIWLERNLIGLIEQWALGVEWLELVSHTSLDEGDVVRMLRRTLDLLSQIPYVPHIDDNLRSNAAEAQKLIDRFPVNEVIESSNLPRNRE
mgnify:CR=1 FL=1